MVPAHRIEAVLSEDGKLSLDHLPFRTGQTVEVILLPVSSVSDDIQSLRGSVLKFDRPSKPVVEDDWNILK